MNRRDLLLSAPAFVAALLPALASSKEIRPYPLQHKRSEDAKGRYMSQLNKSKTLDQRIVQMFARIDSTRMMGNIQTLQNFGTRHSLAPSIGQASAWLARKFGEYADSQDAVKMQPFQMPQGPVLNNVLFNSDTAKPSFILVCAHYDSRAHLPERFDQPAPGADDNGSGVAMLLELASILRGVSLKRGVLLAAFCGEEQGLIGSQACAEVAAKENWPIDLVINLDMIGFASPSNPLSIVVEFDQGNAHPRNDASAKSFALRVAQMAADYTELTVEHTNIWSSDYMPFEAVGFPCVGLYDKGGDEAFYHTSKDTIENVNKGRMVAVAKLLTASVISICELTEA
ncbi:MULTISPECIES: M28 family metallopeptidase [unclassified Mesorhizobium]|uniref:M28 family metallopeptidase n=2 Tax=Mesorhizobium TaxID=68287 RepID=UPI0013DF5540|nr:MULTISPECIES: M28 family metallopeptidase [unclassified Mesorhizobium]